MSGQAKKLEALTSSPEFRRKTGSHKFREQQIASVEVTDLNTSKCTGILRGDGVLVTAQPEIAALVKLGSYGKGVFSRSIPCHGVPPSFSVPRKRVRGKDDGEDPSSGLTKHEQDAIEKLSNFKESQEKRMNLHAEWKKEAGKIAQTHLSAAQLGTVERVSSSSGSCHERSSSTVAGSADKCAEDQGSSEEDPQGNQLEMRPADNSLNFNEQCEQIKEELEQLEKSDQYKMTEYLQLSSEEALYLTQELNLLNVVTDVGRKALSTHDLWDHFCKNEKFLAKYVAYHYYRRKGWVPKSGLKFGVDYVLYKQGPVEYHSSYAVMVSPLTISKSVSHKSSVEQDRTSTPTWRNVVAFDRVSKSVAKDLIICYVTKDTSSGSHELHPFPDCLEKLKIQEMLVRRWEPERER